MDDGTAAAGVRQAPAPDPRSTGTSPVTAATPSDVHLCYCTNVHAGETVADLERMLAIDAAAVRDRIAPLRGNRFPLGLRLAAVAARTLATTPDAMARFRDRLAAGGFEVRTLNGFPYGPFHGTPIKEQVYAPDWSTAERLAYTQDLAEALAAIGPDSVPLSISTMPVTYGPWGDETRRSEGADGLIRAAASLERLSLERGADIALAIEPEPDCILEEVTGAIGFFENHLLRRDQVAAFAAAAGIAPSRAEAALRRRVGICFDVCHSAVVFEDPAAALDAYAGAGIRVPKMQLSTALKVRSVDAAAREAFAALDEPVYLHQTAARRHGAITRYPDLPAALARGMAADGEEWRVHFHAPVYRRHVGAFETTQDVLLDAIDYQRRTGIADHLEVETYTWGVLPEAERPLNTAEGIARELEWAAAALVG